ncbi:probable basic-leucine zipper transcription factor G [Copidosoma floridanum]|uniref:probable basic-leucine zipper transcription factor G n=1 Tax=Copidosoma floridanum TaxID=29053 RepID=UPI0006C9C1E8|nr:probable basic-leucine zipper transcription factor G [Copidosoma floridanum]
MVSCRSCGRNISSGTIRCSKCGTPFHLSCSHRYKISAEGVFNVCCGPTDSVFPGSSAGYQMRTRRNNKRRQPQQQQQQQQPQQNNNNSFGNGNSSLDNSQALGQSTGGPMRFAKVQKVDESSSNMVVLEKPVILDEPSNCLEISNEEDFTEDNFDTNEAEGHSNDSITILDADEPNESTVQTSNISVNESQMKNSITLETVWDGISSLQSSISNISNSLDTVSNHLNTFDPRINDLETTLQTIKNKTTNFENVQNDVGGLKDELVRITGELENIKASQTAKNVDMGEILCEIKEREMKSKNIIIYNVPEDNLRISQDYSTLHDIDQFNALVAARDTSRAREILKVVSNVDLSQIQTRRLGRMRQNFCRPLRVTLLDKADCITIMKSKSLVNRQYTIKTDLTKLQQKKIKDLKEELEKINVDKQNPTMTIKFINGEPQIIPIGQNYFKRE